MKNIKSKEQLLEEIAELKYQNEQYLLQDQTKRKEFAKAFSWYEKSNLYYRTYKESLEPTLPSWEQIYVNLGTLLAAKKFIGYEENIRGLEVRLEDIEHNIIKEKHHNL